MSKRKRKIMKITLEDKNDGVTRVYCGDKFAGVVRFHDNHFLCYSKGRHTTTQSLIEVVRFFNGDYKSCYHNWKER